MTDIGTEIERIPTGALLVLAALAFLLAPAGANAQSAPLWDERDRGDLVQELPMPSGTRGIVMAGDDFVNASNSVTKETDLRFEDLVPGVVYPQIEPGDATSALFRVAGQTGQKYEVAFENLPARLNDGDDALAIEFDGTSAAWGFTNDPSAATRFDPMTPTTIHLTGGHSVVYIWLGAGVGLANDQAEGRYEGEITLRIDQVSGPEGGD